MAYYQRRGQNYVIDVAVAEKAASRFSWRERVGGSIKCMLEASSWLLKASLTLTVFAVVVYVMVLHAILRGALKGGRRCR